MKQQLHRNGSPFVACSGTTIEAGKPPRKSFIKDIIAVGEYKHPIKNWSLTVTDDTLAAYASAMSKALANGVALEVTADHSHKAKDIHGYLRDPFVSNGVLYATHEFIGADSIALAEKCANVSVEIDPDYTDGKGNKYGAMPFISSLVQQPIVPGQTPFQPIEASRGDDDRQVLMFAADIPPKETPMPLDYAALTALVGEPVNEQNIADIIKKLMEQLKSAPAEDSLDMSKGPGKRIAMLSHKATATALAGLSKKLPESVRTKLALSLAGTVEKPSTLCLAKGDDVAAPADAIIAALAELPDLIDDKQEFSKGQQLPGNRKDEPGQGDDKSLVDLAMERVDPILMK